MSIKNLIIFYFLRWLCGWADLVNGLLLVLTLGLMDLEFSLYMENLFLDVVEKMEP